MSSGGYPYEQTVHEFAVRFYCCFCFRRSAWKLKPVFHQLSQFRESGVRGSVTFLHAVMEPPRLLPELALLLPCCVSGTWYIRGDSKLLFVPQTQKRTHSVSHLHIQKERSTMCFMHNHLCRLSWTLQSFCWHWCLFPCWFHFCIWWNHDDLFHSEYKIVTHRPPRTVDGHICMISSRVDTFSSASSFKTQVIFFPLSHYFYSAKMNT